MASINLPGLLHDIAMKVRGLVLPVIGTEEGSRSVGAGAGGDITKQVDTIAENEAIRMFEETGAPWTVFTEERGTVHVNHDAGHGTDNVRFAIMDPIDGSLNAARGIPVVSLSIAVATGPVFGDVTHGIVANLVTGDEYTSTRGEGAWLNGTPMRASAGTTNLEDAVVGIDINPKRGGFSRSAFTTRLGPLFEAPKKLRLFGSNAMSSVLVASGALDAFIDVRSSLRLLDIAGAASCILEAGGCASWWDGKQALPLDELPLDSMAGIGFIAAGNATLMEEITREAVARFGQ